MFSLHWPLGGAPSPVCARMRSRSLPAPITIIENEQQPRRLLLHQAFIFQQADSNMTELRHRLATEKELQHQHSEDKVPNKERDVCCYGYHMSYIHAVIH